MWLRTYTNHGQKLSLPDYVGRTLEDATIDAKKKSFQVIVDDSIHIVGQPGGIIRDQNPKPSSEVKENRKIYVTITKYNADKILVSDLPSLYGRDYNRKKSELGYLNLKTTVRGYKYDSGEADYILEVWYKGKRINSGYDKKNDTEIEKGSTLEFVLSKKSGAEIPVPDVLCKTLNEVQFLFDQIKLGIGSLSEEGSVLDPETAYVIRQNPPADGIGSIITGSSIDIVISQEKPDYCN